MATHPNSLANLKPFPPGVSGNPAGRPKAGAVIAEWMDAMAAYTPEQLREVMGDPSAPAAKVAAARTWLDGISSDRNAAGSPIAGAEVDRICDRTDGKPQQRVELKHDGTLRTVADGQSEATRLLGEIGEALGAGPAATPAGQDPAGIVPDRVGGGEGEP